MKRTNPPRRRRGQTLVPVIISVALICGLILAWSYIRQMASMVAADGMPLAPIDVINTRISVLTPDKDDLAILLSPTGIRHLTAWTQAHPGSSITLVFAGQNLGTVSAADAASTSNTIHLYLTHAQAMQEKYHIGK